MIFKKHFHYYFTVLQIKQIVKEPWAQTAYLNILEPYLHITLCGIASVHECFISSPFHRDSSLSYISEKKQRNGECKS